MTVTSIDASVALRLGTRGSALALAQAHRIGDLWASRFPDHPVEIIPVSTQGDVDKVSPLAEIGGRGVFTNAIEQQIVYGSIDAAIHCAKDMPSRLPDELPIVAFPEREDPRDVLVSRHGLTLAELPPSPVIGTSSRRREAQVRLLRPDAQVISLRGNIDTRLGKAAQETYDGVILAAAGIQRMGWTHKITQYFAVDEFVPSPGQGALAIQTATSCPMLPQLSQLDNAEVSAPLLIERAFLAELGAGCTMPVGAYVHHENGGHCLVAFLADEPGGRWAKTETWLARGAEREHAVEVARRLRAEVTTCSQAHWAGWSPSRQDLSGARVVVTRPQRQAGPLLAELAQRGATPLAMPAIRIESLDPAADLDAALRDLARGAFTWLVFTSANAVDAVSRRMRALNLAVADLPATQLAVVGAATALAAQEAGFAVDAMPAQATAQALAEFLLPRLTSADRVVFPRSDIGRDDFPIALQNNGIPVRVVDAYRTVPETHVEPAVLEHLRERQIDAIVFSSPSAISGLRALLGDDWSLAEAIPAICAGTVTAEAARSAGLHVGAVSRDPGARDLGDAVAAFWSRQRSQSQPLALNDVRNTMERMAGR